MESTGILIQSIQRVTKNRSLQQKKTDVLMPVFLILRSRDMDSTKEMSFISYRKKDSVAGTITDGGSTRYAKAGGYFTYNFIVNPDKGNALLCQFAKEDNGKTIKVMVGDKQIASKKLAYDGTAAFYTEYINIPDDVLKKNVKKIVPEGDTKEYTVVSVRFESGSDAEDSARLVGGLYMTQSFSDQAVLNTLTSSAGEVSSANDTFTIVVPKGTTSVALKYGIADQFGLLYVNDKLVDDTKQQTYELTAAPLSLKVKVYAEDHKTVRTTRLSSK